MKFSCVLATREFGDREELTIKNIQTAFSDIEIVVVTPQEISNKIADKLAIKICKDSRKGIHAAYNLGALQAKGDYLFFAGSGDIYSRKAGRTVTNAMQDNPGKDIYGFGSVWAKWAKVSIQIGNVRQDSQWNAGVLVSGLPVSHQAMFYKREKFLEIGLLDENLKTSSDYKHLANAYLKGANMQISDTCIAIVDNGGISSNQGNLVLEEHIAIVNENLRLENLEFAEKIFRAGKGWAGLDSNESISLELQQMVSEARQVNRPHPKLKLPVVIVFGYAAIFS
jgi:glycosyltransferase involved in cell wall biosynthesis